MTFHGAHIACVICLEFEIDKQAGAELSDTRILSCQLDQCSIQVKSNRVGGYWLETRSF